MVLVVVVKGAEDLMREVTHRYIHQTDDESQVHVTARLCICLAASQPTDTHRQTHGHRDTQTHRHTHNNNKYQQPLSPLTHRQTRRHTHTDTDRHMDTQTDRHTHSHT